MTKSTKRPDEPFPKPHWTTEPGPGRYPVAKTVAVSYPSRGKPANGKAVETVWYTDDPAEAEAERERSRAAIAAAYDIIFADIAAQIDRIAADRLGYRFGVGDLIEMVDGMDAEEPGSGTAWLVRRVRAWWGADDGEPGR